MSAHRGATPERLAKMVHFVVQHTPPDKLGATKLNKVLWFADVMHYRQYGQSISGAEEYVKNQYGPVPNGIQRALAELKVESKIVERPVQTPAGIRREFVWLQPVNKESFSPAEMDTLRDVIEWAASLSAKEISDLTHDALWEETDFGRQISIAAASVTPSEPDEEDLEWARQAFSQPQDDALRSTA